MRRPVFHILLLAAALALAGPGCAHPREKPEMASAPPKKSLKASHPESAEKTKRGPENPGEKKPEKKGKKKKKPAGNRLKLDPNQVLALQMQAIREQSGAEDDCLLRKKCGFTRWLDRVHGTWYRRMDNAVRTMDVKWLAEGASYDYELSTFKLRLMSRMGGRSSEEEADFKVRFRADLALPALERKLHLILENADEDSLPGADPMKQKNDTRLGARALLRTLKDSQLEAGGGLKWRDSGPVAYADLEWRWEREMGAGKLRLNPRGFYFTDAGFGQVTTLSWTKQMAERRLFQVLAAERSSESRDGVEFEQSFRHAWLRSGRGRGWVAQASVFPHLTSSDWIWDDSLVNLTWRDALYRKWIYYTVTSQVQFPKEDEYEARPSIRIGLEILFGGKIGDLM